MPKRWKSTDPYPSNASFGELLEWHLTVWGTNPRSSKAERDTPWVLRNFAAAVHSGLPDGEDQNSPERRLWNWRNDVYMPDSKDEHRIFKVLFGGNPELADWNEDLQNALDAERESKRQRGARASNVGDTGIRAVPRPTALFMGRDQEVEILARELATAEGNVAVLVQGGPGIGKTELTKAISHHPSVASRFAERRYFVPLETAHGSAAMREAVIRAVGGDPSNGLFAAFEKFREQDTLLILDNLETPLEQAEQQGATEQTLREIVDMEGLCVLASLRGRSFIGGPSWHTHALAQLSSTSAADLFAAIASDWTRADPLLASFVDALGGVPLAIELVARRAHGRTRLAPLWREWQAIGANFAKRADAIDSAQTSLAYSIELSLRSPRLSQEPDALRLFSLLGYLPAGMACDDRDRLVGSGTFAAEECLLHSGLAVERGGRLDLLPPVRDYARRHAPMAENDVDTWIQFYLTVGAEFAKSDQHQARWLLEHENIQAAELFDEFRKMELKRDESLANFRRSGATTDQAQWLLSVADVEFRLANYREAATKAAEARLVFQQLDDDVGQGDALTMLGRIEAYQSNFRYAMALLNEALDHYEKRPVRSDRRELDCILPLCDVRQAVEMLDRSEDPGAHPGWRYIIPQRS